MKNIRLFLERFSKGLNSSSRPDIIDNEELQKCENYEIRDNGFLHRRTEPDTYDSDLNTLLASTFDTVLVMSEPYYPETLETNMVGFSDFILFFFGEKASTYKLYAFYKTGASTWTETQISITGITYSSSCDMWINIGEDRVIFTDGVNQAHYFLIDYDGNIVSGKLGVPAPLNKPTITPMTEWDNRDWEDTFGADMISIPGLFQCLYTVVTKDGDESNPSPLSDTLDMQWFKLSSGDDARWLNRVYISNLSIPDVSDDIKDKLRYFNIYIRTIRYSEGQAPVLFQYSQRFDIIDKSSGAVSGTTGNSYTVTVNAEAGDNPSYENDVAPVAKYGLQQAGIIMLANVKKKIKFPFDFTYYCEIKLNNLDSRTFVDAVIRIRLGDKDYATNPILNLDWSAFDTDDDDVIEEVNNLRIYDRDLTTPLPVLYEMNTGLYYCDIYVKIPQLEAGGSHSIYLCFGGTGVDNSDLQGFDYGKFFSISSGTWSEQEVFQHGVLVDSFDSLLCSPMDIEIESDKCPNKSDETFKGALTNATWNADAIAKIPELNQLIGNKSIKSGNVQTALIRFSDYNTTFPKTGYICERIRYVNTDLQAVINKNNLMNLKDTGAADFIILHMQWDGVSKYFWRAIDAAASITSLIEAPSTGTHQLFVMMSWNCENDKVSIFILNMETNDFECEELSLDLSGLLAGTLNNIDFNGTFSIPNAYVDQTICVKNVYLSAENIDDANRFLNIANFMPSFENIVGLKHFDADVIVNGDFANQTFGADATVSGITNANPGVVTYAAGHGFVNGDRVFFHNLTEMTQLNDKYYTLVNNAGDTFELIDGAGSLDTTAYAQETTGGACCKEVLLDDWSAGSRNWGSNGGVLKHEQGHADTFGQTNILTSGLTYLVKLTIKNYVNSSVKVRLGTSGGGSHYGQDRSADGTYIESIVANGVDFKFVPNIAFEGEIDDIEVYELARNNNVSFEETVTIGKKEYKNMVVWSNINGVNFPDLYNKKVTEPINAIITAPSFLKFQYENTNIIFTRNTITRFVLSGTPDQWQARAESLVEQYKQVSLLANKTLKKWKNMLFWLSEVGVIRWDSEGLRVISEKRVDVLGDEDAVAFFSPIRKQYIIKNG